MSNDNENYPDISDETFTTRMLYKMIRTKFPNVQQLSTNTLKSILDDSNMAETIVLVDVREKEEYEISRLSNCIHVSPDSDVQLLLDKIKDSDVIKKVVAYCSVGYRSSQLIQRIDRELKKQNFYSKQIELYNLEGSIFKWANEGKPIIDKNGKETIYVHPYNTIWGKFLEVKRRIYPENSKI